MAIRLRWIAALVAVMGITLNLLLPAGGAAAQATVQVAPQAAAAGSEFRFSAGGFKGKDKGDDNNNGEKVSFWVTTPSGVVISGAENDDDDFEAYEVKANGDGTANWLWTAPADAADGSYLMTALGKKSGTEVTTSFRIATAIVQPGTGGTVSPERGTPGTEFVFRTAGFRPARNPDEGDANGEDVAYWINTPGGQIIDRDAADDDDDDNDERTYRARTDGNGNLQLLWTAPANLQKGEYLMVIRGVETSLEQHIPFTVR